MSRKAPNPSPPAGSVRPPPPPAPPRVVRVTANDPNKFRRVWSPHRSVALDAAVKPARSRRNVVIAKPVFPNAGVEAWYREQLQTIIADMSRSVVVHIRAAWKKADPDIGFASDAPNSSILLRKALEKWGGIWVGKLDALSKEMADRFAGKARSATDASVAKSFADAGLTVQFKPTRAMAEANAAVVGQNVALIKSIPQQYLKDVETSVWQNVMRGGDLSTLSKSIQEQYGKTYKRAALIARDQNAKAKAVMENVRRQELGITEAIWMHSHAGKEPRPTHVAMNGKRYKLTEGMYDSAVQKNIWPGELIECRCTSRAVLEGFE